MFDFKLESPKTKSQIQGSFIAWTKLAIWGYLNSQLMSILMMMFRFWFLQMYKEWTKTDSTLDLTKWQRHTSPWWGYWPLWWWWWPAPGPSSAPGRRRRRGLSTTGAGATWGQCCLLIMTSVTLSCLRSESNILKWSSLNTSCETSFCWFFK